MSKHKGLAATHLRIALKLLEQQMTCSQEEQDLLLLHIQSAMELLQEDREYPEDNLPSQRELDQKKATAADALEHSISPKTSTSNRDVTSSSSPLPPPHVVSESSPQELKATPSERSDAGGSAKDSALEREGASSASAAIKSETPKKDLSDRSQPPPIKTQEERVSSPSMSEQSHFSSDHSSESTDVERPSSSRNRVGESAQEPCGVEEPRREPSPPTPTSEQQKKPSDAPAHTEHRHPPETIAETFSQRSTLVDAMQSHGKTKASRLSSIVTLTRAFSFNDQRHYVKELFGGDKELFVASVRRMDKADSMIEALDILHEAYQGPLDNPALESFVALLERRFNA